ncbi:gamma carbonic anhydrase family protein [Methanolobus bombayensis]|uniref:gamma carbonic anhydrase family protein n=1 Tax=Methanolobus bombayensis TaxID=38023 RepID=UPI001AE14632|nr:gamma carbonic anhydrase family protein [Methanolobus bombayensis]MBP1908026.1 carbonic anhydrase/acetyltransferase-like protein (isoleucine patch superfamily) [Methanolobus bombayensis]
MILKFKSSSPEIADSAFVADNATVIGDVVLGEESSVWFGAVIRGDENPIRIGNRSNVQDNVVIHISDTSRVDIADDVTIGHCAVIHGCKIGSNVLIGMNSTVLDGADIGDNCIIGANALVPPGKKIPAGSMVMGVPAKIVRELTESEILGIQENAAVYVQLLHEYKNKEK